MAFRIHINHGLLIVRLILFISFVFVDDVLDNTWSLFLVIHFFILFWGILQSRGFPVELGSGIGEDGGYAAETTV